MIMVESSGVLCIVILKMTDCVDICSNWCSKDFIFEADIYVNKKLSNDYHKFSQRKESKAQRLNDPNTQRSKDLEDSKTQRTQRNPKFSEVQVPISKEK